VRQKETRDSGAVEKAGVFRFKHYFIDKSVDILYT
jgi:hypothetical protein